MLIKNVFILIVFLFIACKKQVDKEKVISSSSEEIIKTTPIKPSSLKEVKYVNALSGLNYRNKPKGTVLGKLEHNQEVVIVKHSSIFSEIQDNGILIKGEWVGIRLNNDIVYLFDGFLSSHKNKIQQAIWSKFPMKKAPLKDNTNFDNFKKKNRLSALEIKQLHLDDLYPELIKENTKYDVYEAYPSYQLKLNNHRGIVTVVFKGDHEMESVLIVYGKDDTLIKSYKDGKEEPTINSLVISYDEIAEGWSVITSEIKDNCITTIDALYTDIPKIDTLLHHVNDIGYINKINTKFKNNIRPNKNIKLNIVYTDTIKFIKYNDDYDYFYIEGKKNNKDVSLYYNWDIVEKYDFKKNDLIKIKWEMSKASEAGSGETLYFHEYAIDAEKIK